VKRILLCLFTYNRPHFLANAVRSIDEFFPWGDRLIVDDGSPDPRVAEFLVKGLGPAWKYVQQSRVTRNYGGFYNNMRFALEWALEGGYDYCFFFEDDEQFVWRKDDYLDHIEHLFSSCPDAIQLQPLFSRRILTYARSPETGSPMIEYLADAKAYRTERGFNTTAIWNLATIRKNKDYRFLCHRGDDLPPNSAYWLSRGYRLYIEFDPTVAVIPWVASQSYFTHNFLAGHDASRDRSYILRPLSADEIAFLRHRPPELPAYQEYFNLSPENVARPIWHQKGQHMNRYYSLCRAVVELEERVGSSPVPVPVRERWAPTTIPPLASHMKSLVGYPPVSSSQGTPISSTWWKRVLHKHLSKKLVNRLVELRDFSIRDYLGYRALTRKLARERRRLGLADL
jgi:glycosyltransferase involved in cell wall biosynthesis